MTDPRSPDARRAGAWLGRPASMFCPRRIAGGDAGISRKSEYAGGVFVDGTPAAGGCGPVHTARADGESASSPQTIQGAFHDEDMPIVFAAVDPDRRRAD